MVAAREQDQVGPSTDESTDDLALVAELQKPGLKDSTILTLDSVLTLMRLFKAEAALALGTIPALIALNLARAPVYLLTWLSFCMLAACAVYAWFDNNVVLGAATFFLLQLAVALLLEWKIRRLHHNLDFDESRKGFEVMKASLKERLTREHATRNRNAQPAPAE